MDLRDFRQKVTRAAVALAPVYKAGGTAVLAVYVPPAAPFAAMVPSATFLGIGQPALLLIPEYRDEMARELDPERGEIDYGKLGEMAALAALKKGT